MRTYYIGPVKFEVSDVSDDDRILVVVSLPENMHFPHVTVWRHIDVVPERFLYRLSYAALAERAATATFLEIEAAVTRDKKVRGLDPAFAESVYQLIRFPAAPAAVRRPQHASDPAIDSILQAVATHFRIDVSELKGETRVRTISYARHVAMFLAQSLAGWTQVSIARVFNRSMPSVSEAVTKLEKLIRTDPGVERDVREVAARAHLAVEFARWLEMK